jgi:AcrR family transcriptional regulator
MSSNVRAMNPRVPGRPRSEEARLAVLGAAVDLVGECGSAPTMDAIARRAGVSRQTVYRWWSSPAEILLEALNEGAARIAPLQEQQDLDRDLRTFLRRSVLGARGSAGRLLAALMAEAQRDPAFGESFRAGFLAKRRGVLRELLEHAAERGELASDRDADFLAELFFAALWYRLLAASGPLDRRFADDLTDTLLRLARAAA